MAARIAVSRYLGPRLGARLHPRSIDGREAHTMSDGFQVTDQTRGFDFDVFAPELFSSLTVRKTPSVEIEDAPLRAPVDLQMGRPFDRMSPQLALSIGLSYYDRSNECSRCMLRRVSDRIQLRPIALPVDPSPAHSALGAFRWRTSGSVLPRHCNGDRARAPGLRLTYSIPIQAWSTGRLHDSHRSR